MFSPPACASGRGWAPYRTMTEEDPPHTPEEAALRRAEEAAATREAMEGSAPVLLLGLIPVCLVLLFLWLLLGDWVHWLIPVALFSWFYGLPLTVLARRFLDSPLPLDIPGHGRFEGASKRRLVWGGALLLLGLFGAYLLARVWFSVGFLEVRDWLVGWG
jgi:hypothetical protein